MHFENLTLAKILQDLHFSAQNVKENYLYAKNDTIAHIRASRFYIIGMPYLHHEHCMMLLL